MKLRLVDLYCTKCEAIVEDVFCSKDRCIRLCPECGLTAHAVMVNGGLKSRWRFCDFPDDPEFYRGQVKAKTVTARDSYGNDVKQYDSSKPLGEREGVPMHDNDKYQNGSDKRETRRDQKKHDTRRTRGTLPIVCDLGSKGQ